MSLLLGIAALVGVSAITPGPNNVVVMSAAAHRGFAGALPAIAGVVLGSLITLLVAVAGVGAALAAVPALGPLMSVAGCVYLCYLGGRMLAAKATKATDGVDVAVTRASSRSGLVGLLVFQFLNPKGWAMVLTAVSAAQAGGRSAIVVAYLAVIFVIVPTVCLALWSLSGALLSAQLRRPMFRLWFDRAMGSVLIASALAMLVNAWPASGSAILGGLWS